MNHIMFCYNFMRTKNILGFEKMLQAIKNRQPDYNKIVCDLKNAFLKAINNELGIVKAIMLRMVKMNTHTFKELTADAA